eukprot:TRINITY_DN11070_c0_g2_i7.p2 TRINITY_DN11070_c0_g2~~TRINITY_DN11070_c0_g2_i7.p2  ORF type:complete len:187 (+),score=39.37 TRINITY_DN11070_c0_g2_i7:66-626(+)
MSLGQAAVDGAVQEVKRLLYNGVDPNVMTQDGHFPLTLAAFWGHEAVVEALLEHGADVNVQNKSNGWTALHAASLQGHAKIVFQLFDYSPRLDIADHNDCTASDFASALDTIWPHFAAESCIRTSKEELIRKNIIYKVEKAPTSTINEPQPYFNRPGSAYVMNMSAGARTSKRPQFSDGDVLEEEL